MTALMSGLGGWGAAWLCLGAGCAVVLLGCCIGAVITGVRGLLRGLGRLMDAGDGQGGVPATRPLPLAGLVISPELERHAAWRAAQLARQGAAAVCTRCARDDTRLPCACRADCYAAYCMGGLS